jgi:3-dehydroquinate dehydratase-2
MKKILIINGPNLNLLGRRQPQIYGSQNMDNVLADAQKAVDGSATIEYFQSNHEGAIIDELHRVGFDTDNYLGVVLNAGAYTHTSLAIADAIAAINLPVIEVHISNVFAREDVRHHSAISPVCKGIIAGLGTKVYTLAALSLAH